MTASVKDGHPGIQLTSKQPDRVSHWTRRNLVYAERKQNGYS
jgi:hypothetical protein